LLRRIDKTGSTDRKVGSGRSRSARTSVSQHTKAEELICSEEDASGNQKRLWEIEQITGIARSSVVMLTGVLADHIAASLVNTLTYIALYVTHKIFNQ